MRCTFREVLRCVDGMTAIHDRNHFARDVSTISKGNVRELPQRMRAVKCPPTCFVSGGRDNPCRCHLTFKSVGQNRTLIVPEGALP
jgi:hypothetical protein